jgi:hypothetical protein
MRSSKPPELASWLIEHLIPGIKKDALVGDLLEEFNQGRSAAWYWYQALVAVLVNFSCAIWRQIGNGNTGAHTLGQPASASGASAALRLDAAVERQRINLSWQSEDSHLICRWSGVGERAPYDAPWMHDVGNEPKPALPTFLDFTRVSPFGGRRW